MKRTIFLKTLSVFVFTAFFCLAGYAQNPPASPPAKATGKIGDANITIDYSAPSVKGRKIFGGLEAYGKPWRAGANRATILETDKQITIEGKTLPAGKYSLFLTPGENEWTVILNSETGQWGIKRGGEANRDPAKDVVTATVKPVKSSTLTEQLAYSVNNNGITMKWENVEVPISIK